MTKAKREKKPGKMGGKKAKSRELRMVKRQVSFSKPDYEWLTTEAKMKGVSVSEFVRRLVSHERDRRLENWLKGKESW